MRLHVHVRAHCPLILFRMALITSEFTSLHLTHPLPRSLTHSLTHSLALTHSLTLSLTHSLIQRMVQVVDMLPGGLEPLDPNIYNDAATAGGGGGGGSAAGGGFLWDWRRWWCGWFYKHFNERETLKDEVRWTSNWLPAGTYTLEYKAIATTTGCFAFPPAKVRGGEGRGGEGRR